MVKEGDMITVTKGNNSSSGFSAIAKGVEGIVAGGVNQKFFTIIEAGRRTLNLVIKDTLFGADKYLDNYNALKDAGVPVVKTMRKVDEKHVAMTDLRAQGATFFGKAMGIAMRRALSESQQERLTGRKAMGTLSSQTIQIFFEATSKTSSMEKILGRYAKRATRKGIVLPSDEVFEMVVFSTGEAKWILLDLDKVLLENPASPDSRTHKEIKRENEAFVHDTIRNVELLRDHIQTLGLHS